MQRRKTSAELTSKSERILKQESTAKLQTIEIHNSKTRIARVESKYKSQLRKARTRLGLPIDYSSIVAP